MNSSLKPLFTFLFAVLLASGCTATPPPATDADIAKVVDAFYGAMKTGDKAAIMATLAPDALFVEGGKLETRAEYEANHLPADIEFEQQVTGQRAPMKITFHGNAAWMVTTTEYHGTFGKDPVNFVSAQLMVLTRDDTGKWLIRSAHWSSRRLNA